MSRPVSFPEAYLQLKMGKAIRLLGWKDKSIVLVPERKEYIGTVAHPLVKQYLIGLEEHEVAITVPERFQLVYSPYDSKVICSNGMKGPQVIDNYQISADEMRSLEWVVHDFI